MVVLFLGQSGREWARARASWRGSLGGWVRFGSVRRGMVWYGLVFAQVRHGERVEVWSLICDEELVRIVHHITQIIATCSL